MRLAILADIHGSIPSLEAALHEIHHLGVDGMLVAGDMTCGPNSNEVLQILQQENSTMVLGNNEEYLLRFDSGEAPDWWHTSRQWAFTRWVYQHMEPASLDLLRSLPKDRIIEIPGTDSIRLFHGSPWNASEHLYSGFNPEALAKVLARTSEAVLICGHCHVPWKERQDGRLAFNPGAIFFPDNGDQGAQYAILDWVEERWRVEHHAVLYDHSLVRAAYKQSGLLDAGGAFARACLGSLETGRNLVVELLTYAYGLSKEAGHGDEEYVCDEIWDRAAETFDWEGTAL